MTADGVDDGVDDGALSSFRGNSWVSLILDILANGQVEADLRAEFPQLAHDDVLAAIAYGADAATDAPKSAPTCAQ